MAPCRPSTRRRAGAVPAVDSSTTGSAACRVVGSSGVSSRNARPSRVAIIRAATMSPGSVPSRTLDGADRRSRGQQLVDDAEPHDLVDQPHPVAQASAVPERRAVEGQVGDDARRVGPVVEPRRCLGVEVDAGHHRLDDTTQADEGVAVHARRAARPRRVWHARRRVAAGPRSCRGRRSSCRARVRARAGVRSAASGRVSRPWRRPSSEAPALRAGRSPPAAVRGRRRTACRVAPPSCSARGPPGAPGHASRRVPRRAPGRPGGSPRRSTSGDVGSHSAPAPVERTIPAMPGRSDATTGTPAARLSKSFCGVVCR